MRAKTTNLQNSAAVVPALEKLEPIHSSVAQPARSIELDTDSRLFISRVVPMESESEIQ
jgi:hypothetical protein